MHHKLHFPTFARLARISSEDDGRIRFVAERMKEYVLLARGFSPPLLAEYRALCAFFASLGYHSGWIRYYSWPADDQATCFRLPVVGDYRHKLVCAWLYRDTRTMPGFAAPCSRPGYAAALTTPTTGLTR